MRLMLLDCDFQLDDADSYTFSTKVSAFDYDLVIWDPENTVQELSPMVSDYRGRPSLREAQSVTYREAIKRRRREFADLLRLGRTIVVFGSGPEIVWLDTGKRTYSGTGRNQKTTTIVEDVDLWAALPAEVSSTAARGLEMEVADERIRGLWRETSESWIYRGILDEYPGTPLLRVAGTDKVVASLLTNEFGGNLVILPQPWVPPADEEDEGDATASAMADAPEETETIDRLAAVNALVAWIEGLSYTDAEQLPPWTSDYRFSEESARSHDLSKLEEDLAEVLEKIDGLKAEQAASDQWKRLVAADGAALESQVVAAFEKLGCTVLEVERGRSDVRLGWGQYRFVVEVKGTSRSAAEKHAAQLEKWVAEETAAEHEVKGILVVNAWRNMPLVERTDDPFPHQMLGYSRSRGHCLVTGLQLLSMVKAVEGGSSSAEQVMQLLRSTVGCIEGWDDIREVFVQGVSQQSSSDELGAAEDGAPAPPAGGEGAEGAS